MGDARPERAWSSAGTPDPDLAVIVLFGKVKIRCGAKRHPRGIRPSLAR